MLLDGSTDLSIDELLAKAEVERADHEEALETSSRGNIVVLKREPSECCINNYNSSVMLAWQATNHGLTVCTERLCLCHVSCYIMKTDRAIGEIQKRVATEARTEELKPK